MENNEVEKQDVVEIDFVSIILAFFLPPLGVLIKDGFGLSLLLNVLLTFLGWFPGVLHAFYVIFRKK